MNIMDQKTEKKLQEIAKKLGISLDKLLETKSPRQIIEEYEKGEDTEKKRRSGKEISDEDIKLLEERKKKLEKNERVDCAGGYVAQYSGRNCNVYGWSVKLSAGFSYFTCHNHSQYSNWYFHFSSNVPCHW